MQKILKNTLFTINTCFSKEIYEEIQLYQKLNNIHFVAENYICDNSKIFLVNDGPIDISINNNKIESFPTQKRLGRDVDSFKKFIRSLDLYVNSNFKNLLWVLDDFYIFPSFIEKINSSTEDILFSRYCRNEFLFESFLYIKNNKSVVRKIIDFFNNNTNNRVFDEETFAIMLDYIKLKNSKNINLDLIKSYRPHKNFELLSNQELIEYSIYDLLYQSIGFDGGVYSNDKFLKNT